MSNPFGSVSLRQSFDTFDRAQTARHRNELAERAGLAFEAEANARKAATERANRVDELAMKAFGGGENAGQFKNQLAALAPDRLEKGFGALGAEAEQQRADAKLQMDQDKAAQEAEDRDIDFAARLANRALQSDDDEAIGLALEQISRLDPDVDAAQIQALMQDPARARSFLDVVAGRGTSLAEQIRVSEGQANRDNQATLQGQRLAVQQSEGAKNRASLEGRARIAATRGPGVVVNAGEKPQIGLKELSKVEAKRLGARMEATDKLTGILPDLERLEASLDQFNTGAAGETRLLLGQFANLLGADVEGLEQGEMIQAIQARLAPAMRVTGSGASSDRDVQLFMQSLPNLSRTVEGNRQVIDHLKRIAERRQVEDAIMQDSVLENGVVTREAKAEIRSLGPLFSDEERAAMRKKPEVSDQPVAEMSDDDLLKALGGG